MASRNQRKKRANQRAATAARSEQVQSTQPSREHRAAAGRGPRRSTETKSALRTTELIAYVLTVLAVVMTALALDADGEGGADPFGAEPAIRYITYLTIGYLVARGLAKAGSWQSDGRRRSHGSRVAASAVHDDDEALDPAATDSEHGDHDRHGDHGRHGGHDTHDDHDRHDDHSDPHDSSTHGAPVRREDAISDEVAQPEPADDRVARDATTGQGPQGTTGRTGPVEQ